MAALLLAAYGVEVCPYIEGIGHVGVLPAMAIGFVSAFCLRIVVYRFVARSTGAVLGIEMFCWLVAGAGLTAYDTFVLGFPVGSGLTVMVGFLAIGLSTSTYVALLTERDLILEGQADPQRSGPLGRASSISTRLYWFVLASQVLLAVVLMALISKDFAYLVEAIAVGLEPSFRDIALEIGASFVVLLIINAIVARRYAG
ncbi:MAG: hypothetical protein VX938_04915, partial [Myxococcota bacterium]|nr:hypothetical protein [Myxococcota bacterium]